MVLRVNPLRLVLVAAVVLGLSLLSVNYYRQTRIEPTQLVEESRTNSLSMQTYRYFAEARLQLEGRERILSRVEGEKAGENYHIKGVMLEQPVEVYVIDRITYLQDTITQKWMVTPGNDFFPQDMLMTELNPMSSFSFTNVGSVEYVGREKVRDRKNYVLTLQGDNENEFLKLYWKDFNYRLWIDQKTHRLTKAVVNAVHRSNAKDTLQLSVEFYDYDQRIKLKPPK